MALIQAQREKAVRMWREGASMKRIANAMGLTMREITHEIEWRRELYPRRYKPRGGAR